jgi:drug/metabolite transporter (DMT)-like permease
LTSSAAGRWLLLATLWSLQYIFMRIAVPVFGTGIVAEARALFAAAFLAPWVLLVTREPLMLGANWRDHLAVCMVNNVLPFICFAYAATALPASYLAVMNGMVPLWPTALAAAAGVAGAAFWGWAGVVIRQRTGRVPPISLAAGSILFAAILLAPAWIETPPLSAWAPGVTGALVALGALVSGLAYLPFFTLVREIGPTRTLTVGLAVPALGILWGWLLLGETITASMLAGAALVLVALLLVMKH